MYNRNLDQRIEEQNKKANRPPIVEDEETDEVIERPYQLPLNMKKSIFDTDNTKIFGEGINKAPSIFEKKAIFHTGEGGK